MTESHLVGFLGTGSLFEGKSIHQHTTFNHPPRQTSAVCPYCFLSSEFECPICKED